MAEVDTNDNTVSIILTSQALAAAGRGYADVTLQLGTQILSSVSFVIIVMSAPDIVNQVASSNEFGYLNEVLSDATNIIYEAESWAVGQRGGTDVIDESSITTTYQSSVITSILIDEEIFNQKVKSEPGTSRTFLFTFKGNNIWELKTTQTNGIVITEGDSELINNLTSYGVFVETIGGVEPNIGDQVRIIKKEKDVSAENNAKYYAEQASISKKAIDDLSVSGESIPPGEQIEVVKTIDEHVNFHFKIPKSEVHFLTFGISPTTGELRMTRPSDLTQVDFEIIEEGDNKGCLGIKIMEEYD